MFGLETLGAKILAGALALFLLFGAVGGTYMYIHNIKQELKISQQNVASLESLVKHKQAIIDYDSDMLKKKGLLIIDLNGKITNAQTDYDSLKKKFTDLNGKYNTLKLKNQAKVDPVGAEATINELALQSLRCNEIATGSPVGEADKTNTVCPKLVGGN